MKFKPKQEDGRGFVKIEDGKSIQGVFRGDLFEFYLHWVDKKGEPCRDRATCEFCKAGNKAKFRFRVNFITKDEEGKYVSKIFEQGPQVYKTLAVLNEGDFPLEKNVVRIMRSGTELNTSYMILPVPNGHLDATKEAIVAAVPLQKLGFIDEQDSEPEETKDLKPIDQVSGAADDDIPF